jgi:Na+/melibiose symporter-like transporter
MPAQSVRIASLVGAVLIIFTVTVLIALRVLPGPHSEVDYLVIGSIATFISLVVVFFVLNSTWLKSRDLFYTRRRKAAPTEEK